MSETSVKKATNNEEIIILLQDDMRGEHAAIIQYLQHAYKLGEEAGDLPGEIEGIARDEMRHFRWLGELIVELGGDPTMERDPIFLAAPTKPQLLALDVDAEQRAIDQYREHIEAIDHPKVNLYLRRILQDELFHQGKFRTYLGELGGKAELENATQTTGPWNANPNPPGKDLELSASGQAVPADLEREDRNDHPLVKMLNSRIQSEYETILIYLHQAFLSKNAEQRNHLVSDQAVWHMTHMGTLGEAVAELEAEPQMEVDFSRQFLKEAPVEPQEFHQWAIEREQGYVKNSKALLELAQKESDDEGLLADLHRIEGHDKFQVEQLKLDPK